MAVAGGRRRIEIRDLEVRLGDTGILNGIDLEVDAGDLLAIIGPNGAGKSTLLRALDGLQAAHRGRVEVDGREVSDYRRRDLARVVSFVPQNDVPADDYTVRAFVEMGRYPHLATWSALTAADRRVVDEALELTEIDHLAARSMKTLSGGERQRVWIAAALAQGGTILLLDEPTSFLDYRHQVQILDLLGRLHAEGGYTVVAVTHDLNGLVADADAVLAIVDGRVEFFGSPRALFDSATLARIFGNDFVLVDGGRHGLPLVMPARNGS
jgi:ABC-type cobalamin/Fe3+-siderophores transport system ATPase subunit